ncbi:hypothetical protein JVU11DRAFT_8886 [Chiua virens]|nr:hypothetical protein JVU11DRAFT_8886 [Chiua virens]
MSKSRKDSHVSVLNDFDLSMIEGSVRGNKHTGEIGHKYKQDLESFLWVLLWICLHYDKGKLCDMGYYPFDECPKVNMLTCWEKKPAFLSMSPPEKSGEGYESTWLLAYKFLWEI